MKRLLVLSAVCALLVGLNAGAVSAHGNSEPFPQYEVKKVEPEEIEKWFQELLQQFVNQIPSEEANVEKPVPVEVTPVPPVTPVETDAPSRPDSAQAVTDEEQQMVNLVNQERQKQGLAPLKINSELVKVARLKAKDMIENNYFDHQSPTYGSPFDMMNQFNISYRTAGENLAGHQTVEGAHNGLMNSPGHRANILNESFTEVGIGIVDGGPYGKMFVQLFKG